MRRCSDGFGFPGYESSRKCFNSATVQLSGIEKRNEEVGKVLQELAVAQTSDMQAAPSKQMVQEPAAAAAAEDDDDSEMLARLQQLRS